MIMDATGLPVMQSVLARTPWVRSEDTSHDPATAWAYELAIALGYGPRSWDGMWKLTRHPFTFRLGCIIAREVVYEPGTSTARIAADGETIVTRLVAHRPPPGWHLICNSRLTAAADEYFLVAPE